MSHTDDNRGDVGKYDKLVSNASREKPNLLDTNFRLSMSMAHFYYSISLKDKELASQWNMTNYLQYPFEKVDVSTLLNHLHPKERRQVLFLEYKIEEFTQQELDYCDHLTFLLSHYLKNGNEQYIKILRYIKIHSTGVAHSFCLDVSKHSFAEGVALDMLISGVAPKDQKRLYTLFDKTFLQGGDPKFTKRQLEVLKAWSDTGLTDLAAKRLRISTLTFETHLKNMRQKLGVHRTVDVLLFAQEQGWV